MNKNAKITALLALTTLLGGWALPSRDVKAKNTFALEGVALEVTTAEVQVDQNSNFDPSTLVVTGTFDSLDHSIVDTTKPGLTAVTFIARKGLETIKLSKTINIRDGVAPEITGDDVVELRFQSDFDILSAYTATDNFDTEVKLELEGEVDRETAGEYTVVVKATDSSNNETTKEVKVTVLEDPEVVARNQRNEEYAGLIQEAHALNNQYLSETSVSSIESMLNRVSSASNQDSDHIDELKGLTSELSSKLERAKEYHAPAAPVQTTTTTVTSGPTNVAPRASSTVNTYGAGWCTWWVADQRAAAGNPIPNNWGNAITWLPRAQAQGYATGYTPVVGSIAYFPGANHVAYVEAVHGDGTITISEMGAGYRAWGFNRRVIPASSAAYIY